MTKGDIVLVPFPFTDLSGSKLRPALVLVNRNEDVVVAFITSQIAFLDEFDFPVKPTLENGLKKPSLIRLDKLASIDKRLVAGEGKILGTLTKMELEKIDVLLGRMFQLFRVA